VKAFAAAVLWGSVLAALAFPWAYPALIIDDSPSYLIPARNWARGGGLTESDGSPLHQRLPLYPFTLGVTIRLFGDDPRTLGLLNAALHVAAILVVRAALPIGALRDLVSGLALVYPPLLTSSGFVLQESLLSLTLALVFLAMRRALARPGSGAALATGMAIGLSALAKTTVAAVAPLFALAVWREPRGPWRTAAMLLGCLVPLLPWMAHNGIAFGRPGLANSNAAISVFAGTASNNIQPDWDSFSELVAARADWNGADPVQRGSFDRFLLRRAIERIAADPGRWALLAAERAVRFALPARHWFFATGLSKPASLGPIYAAAIAFQALLFAASAWLILAVRTGKQPLQDLAAPILVFGHQLVYALSYASPRYGATVGPVLFGGLVLALAGNGKLHSSSLPPAQAIGS